MGKNDNVLDSYTLKDGGLEAKVSIVKSKDSHIKKYEISIPKMEKATWVVLEDVKIELLKKVNISSQEVLNLRMAEQLKSRFLDSAKKLVTSSIPHITEKEADMLSTRIVQEMLGLGDIEFLLKDDWIEEICVNGSQFPLWVYHRKYGWLPTTITLSGENQIWNYSSA